MNDSMETAEVIFITVPTNDIEHMILRNEFDRIAKENKKGIIVIKSTVKPGTTNKILARYMDRDIAFVPEFLRENSAVDDSLNPDKLVIGAYRTEVAEKIKEVFAGLIKEQNLIEEGKVLVMKPIEAEFSKIALNSLALLKVVYSNELYDLCDAYGADYKKLLEVFKLDQNINDRHLNPITDSYRGAGGKCLPKDTKFMLECAERKGGFFKVLHRAYTVNTFYLHETGYKGEIL